MTKHSQPVLGIDIGRVIIGAADPSGKADTSFFSGSDEAALSTPASEGAFDAIAELTRAFAGRVWLVSKCGPRIQQLTRRWLQRQSFYERTCVRQDRVRFCLKRPEKRDHCAAIGATHFVDDRDEAIGCCGVVYRQEVGVEKTELASSKDTPCFSRFERGLVLVPLEIAEANRSHFAGLGCLCRAIEHPETKANRAF